MTDIVSKEKRSEIMSRIRSYNTSFEDRFRKELWNRGLRYRKNVKKMMGKPDIYSDRHKLVIFLDSCFWHGCKQHCRMPSSNVDYWKKKIERNKERDKEVTKYYRDNGFKIIRIWEHEMKHDYNKAVNTVLSYTYNK